MNTLDTLLTIVIPVKNEERNLPECLESVKAFMHVIIVDSGSTDATCDIAARYGREVVQFKWDGHFPKKRNWMLKNYDFETPWVFFLDADERVTSDLRNELEKILPSTTHNAFITYMDNWFMGRLLRHGDHPRKTNLLRLGCGAYERIDEERWSQMDMEVNEHILVSGTVGILKNHLDHFDKRSLSSYFQKHNEYSSWEANRFLAMTPAALKLQSKRQRVKYGLIYTSKLMPALYFVYSYFIKGGFLDGVPGFYFVVNRMSYFYQIQAKIVLARNGKPTVAKT